MTPALRDELIAQREQIADQVMKTMVLAKAQRQRAGAEVAMTWVEALLAQQTEIYAQCTTRDQMLIAVGAELMLQNFYARWKNGIPEVHVDYLALVK